MGDDTTSRSFIIVGWISRKGLEKNWDRQNANKSFNKSSCCISSADVLQVKQGQIACVDVLHLLVAKPRETSIVAPAPSEW